MEIGLGDQTAPKSLLRCLAQQIREICSRAQSMRVRRGDVTGTGPTTPDRGWVRSRDGARRPSVHGIGGFATRPAG